jgi:hypothetical protein
LEPEIEANAKRRVYWNHSIGWLRMHEFILNQQGDMFDVFITHVKKILEQNPGLAHKNSQNAALKQKLQTMQSKTKGNSNLNAP